MHTRVGVMVRLTRVHATVQQVRASLSQCDEVRTMTAVEMSVLCPLLCPAAHKLLAKHAWLQLKEPHMPPAHTY